MPKPAPITEYFTAAQAARHSGLSSAMVNYLCRQGVVEPTLGSARGHGVRRKYSFGDLVALRLVARLSAAGVSVLRLKKAMMSLRRLHPEITLTSLPASHVVTDGRDLYLHKNGEPFERVLDGQFAFAFVVELGQIQREVGHSLSKGKRLSQARGMAA
jgi:DNA-binding transcriptional MerR regulator